MPKTLGSRLKAAIRTLLDTSVAGRNVSTRSDDRFIVSYPKSGNTWMRFLLANLVSDEVGFGSIEDLVPDIYRHKDSKLALGVAPRLLKSHEYFDPRYSKVVYLVRDPRDVAVSYFHHHKKFQHKNSQLSLTEFVGAFLDGNLDNFGSWTENVGSWTGACQQSDNFYLVRYEDLKENTNDILASVAAHFGISATPTSIAASISRCEFNRMQRMEKREGHAWKSLAGTRSDIAFVRQGKIGTWRKVLSAGDARKIEKECRSLMISLGYIRN